MTKSYKYCFTAVILFFVLVAQGQSIFTLSGASKGANSYFNFYSPLVTGSQTFSNSIVSSGPVQMLTDTSAVFDTTLSEYDIDSIPEQLVVL